MFGEVPIVVTVDEGVSVFCFGLLFEVPDNMVISYFAKVCFTDLRLTWYFRAGLQKT